MKQDNSFRDYLIYIGQFKVLSREDEVKIAKLMKDEDEFIASEAREKLINHNLKLVVSIAKNYKNARLSLFDLVQEGNIGLMTAVDKFNPDLGYRFSTCATPWIKQAILKAITDKGRNIRLPAHIFQLMAKYKTALAELESENEGAVITDKQIADRLGVEVEKVKLLREQKYDTVSLSSPLGDEADGDTLEDTVADDSESPAEYAERQMRHDALLKGIHQLKPRTQTIMKLRFGLAEDGDPAEFEEEHTLEEVGAYVGLTRERVRQIEKEALLELRNLVKGVDIE